MKKAIVIPLALVGLSVASENITITNEMADALGKNEITQLYLETGNTLVKAKVSESEKGFSICDAKNKKDCIKCSTSGILLTSDDVCYTYVNGVKVSEKMFSVDYIRNFYVEIVKMHRKVK